VRWKFLGNYFVRYSLAIFAGLGLIFFVEYSGLLEGINNYFYDLSFRLRGPRQSSDRIVIVAIDEGDLERLGRWPIRRLYYARLLDLLKEADVVAFDIIMAEPSQDDNRLAEAMRRHGNVILPVYIDSQLNIVCPTKLLAPYRTGHIHLEPGIDGITRKVFHTIHFRDIELRSLSATIFETFIGTTFYRLKPKRTLERRSSADILQMDLMGINYYGTQGTFQRISLVDILDNKYPSSAFRDKMVLVGITAAGLGDKLLTPFYQLRRDFPGVEIHANILNNLLTNSNIRVVAGWMRWLFVVIICIPCFLLFVNTSERRATLFWVLALMLTQLLVFVLFSTFNLWLSPAAFVLSITFVYVITYMIRLDEAARGLDREYSHILSNMRWKPKEGAEGIPEKGLYGFLTTGGINSKIRGLGKITDQILFEKALTDTALYSEIHGVMLFDPNGRLILANNRAKDTFEALPVEMGTVENFIQGISPFVMEDEGIEDKIRSMEKSRDDITFTLSITEPKKSFLKMDISALTFAGSTYLFVVFTDITRIKELELLKGQIVSMVSHEIKTPIASILGFSELLMNSVEGEMREFTGIINDEANRLIRFINTFLDISRIEAGKQEIRRMPVDMLEVISEVIHSIRPVAEKKQINVKKDTPIFVTVLMLDRDLTKQCMLNLVENAIKYSPPEKDIMIKITEEKERLRVDIIDHGYGMKEQDICRIFEKFYRVRSESTMHIKGSGLGLPFVKEAVEAQGGTISVKSAIDKGSIFSVALPKVI